MLPYYTSSRRGKLSGFASYCILQEEDCEILDNYIFGESSADMGVSLKSGEIKILSKHDVPELIGLINDEETSKMMELQDAYDFIKGLKL